MDKRIEALEGALVILNRAMREVKAEAQPHGQPHGVLDESPLWTLQGAKSHVEDEIDLVLGEWIKR